MATYRVHIVDDFASMRLRVYVMRPWGEGRTRVYGPHLLTDQSDTVLEDGTAIEGDVNPTFEIDRDAAPALLAALLAKQLGAVEHPEQLRKDYEHERDRVDRLMGHLIVTSR